MASHWRNKTRHLEAHPHTGNGRYGHQLRAFQRAPGRYADNVRGTAPWLAATNQAAG